MFHLFQHSNGKLKGKYDFAFVSKGKYICGSNQGYSRKKSAINAILSILKSVRVDGCDSYYLKVQDDTLPHSKVFSFWDDNVVIGSATAPSKKYIPNKK